MAKLRNFLALFFEDVRYEFGNKLSLMGQIQGDLSILNHSVPVDRLAVLLVAKCGLDEDFGDLAVRIVLPRQDDFRADLPVQRQHPPKSQDDPSAFAGRTVQVAMQLRFPPLQEGDEIEVWLRSDEDEYPAGRLRIVGPPAPLAEAQASTQNGDYELHKLKGRRKQRGAKVP